MEMLIGSGVAMFIGFLAGRAMKLKDVDTIALMTMAGGGSCAAGLALLWIAHITIGTSASPLWIVAGVIGGVLGIIVYKLCTFLPAIVSALKKEGLL